MKRITFSRKQILRAIHAACMALFFAACAVQASAAPAFSPQYTVSGSNVTGSGTNTTSAYFIDTAPNGYAITIASGANLGNTTGIGNGNELEFDHGSVNNSGTLSASNYAIYIYNDGNVNNTGTIIGNSESGVYIGGNGTVTNLGTISGANDAWSIAIAGNGTITNSGTMSSGYGVAVTGGGTLNNSGTITGNNGNGVYFGNNATVTNSGSIYGFSASVAILDNGTVTNSGSITGYNDQGVYITGNGTVTNNSGGTILSNYSAGITIDGTGTVSNSGGISSNNSDAIDIYGGGTVTNNSGGTISGSGAGVYIFGTGTVINNGSVFGDDFGVQIEGNGTVTNSGSLTSLNTNNSAYGIDIIGTGTVINSGSVSASGIYGNNNKYSNYGVYIGGNGTVTNSGTINALYSEISNYDIYISGTGTVTNSGYISTFTSSGGNSFCVYIGTGTVTNSGTISAAYGLIASAGVDIDGNGTVTNSGSIRASKTNNTNYGVDIQGNGTVANSGSISAVYSNNTNYGVYIGGNGTVTNSRNIEAGDGMANVGVYIGGNGTVTNTASGYIQAGFIIPSPNNHGTGVYIGGQGNVTNSGYIGAHSASFSSPNMYGVDLNGSNSVLNAEGGEIRGDTDSVFLNGSNSTVNVVGRSSITSTMEGNGNPGNVLNLNLVGLTPAQLTALKAEVITAGTGSGSFEVNPAYTYSWDGFSAVNDNAISLELAVDPGLVAAATAIDNKGLPAYNRGGSLGAQFDEFYVAAAANPEAALNELVGREINQGLDTIGLSLNTTLASDLNQHLDNLLTGGQIGGVDVGGLHISDTGSMVAFSDTTSQLDSLVHMTGSSVLGGTEMSTDAKQMVAVNPVLPRWGMWASGNVTLGDESGSNTLSGFHSTLGSPTFGFDYRVTPNIVLGVLASYTTGGVNFDDGSKIGVNTEIGALYGTWRDGNWHVNGIAGGGTSQFNDTRTTFGGLSANSTPRGEDILTDWTGGYDFHLGDRWNITPEVGLQYTHLDIDSFTESGAGALDLSEGSQTIDSLRSHVGFKVDKAYSLGKDLTFIPELRALWYHEYLDDSRGVSTSLPGAPALGSFSVNTFSPQRDFALVGVGLNTAFTGYHGVPVGLFLNYNAQVGQSDYIAHSVNTGIRVDF